MTFSTLYTLTTGVCNRCEGNLTIRTTSFLLRRLNVVTLRNRPCWYTVTWYKLLRKNCVFILNCAIHRATRLNRPHAWDNGFPLSMAIRRTIFDRRLCTVILKYYAIDSIEPVYRLFTFPDDSRRIRFHPKAVKASCTDVIVYYL